jgi:hypothetical protein
MNTFAFALTPVPGLAPALDRAAATLRATLRSTLRVNWQRLSRLEQRVVAGGGVTSLALVLALALTCQASVARGERLRAEQRQGLAGAATLEPGAMVGGAAFSVSMAKPAAAL